MQRLERGRLASRTRAPGVCGGAAVSVPAGTRRRFCRKQADNPAHREPLTIAAPGDQVPLSPKASVGATRQPGRRAAVGPAGPHPHPARWSVSASGGAAGSSCVTGPVIHHTATPRTVPQAPGSCPSYFLLITRESSQIFKHARFLQEFPCWVL